MKINWLATTAAALTLFGASNALADNVIVECDDVTVTMTEEEAAAVSAKTGTETFGSEICKVAAPVVAELDPATLTDPREFEVTMPSGDKHTVILQVKQ